MSRSKAAAGLGGLPEFPGHWCIQNRRKGNIGGGALAVGEKGGKHREPWTDKFRFVYFSQSENTDESLMLICIFSLTHFPQLVCNYTVSAMSNLTQSQHKICFSTQRSAMCFWTRFPQRVANSGRPFLPQVRTSQCFLWSCRQCTCFVKNFSNSPRRSTSTKFSWFSLINHFDSPWPFVYHVALPSLDNLRPKEKQEKKWNECIFRVLSILQVAFYDGIDFVLKVSLQTGNWQKKECA